MCGICGIYNKTNRKCIEKSVLTGMMNAILHRGPDGSDSVITDRIGFGFNRLSFLDLEGGMQPLFNEDRSVIMVCNGEIFNYRELREELIQKGHSFRTKTDVEVILYMYEEYGLDFPKYLNGQFAIALYDEKRDDLILVRDQAGICPLYYSELDGRVLFGSEIKAILEYPGVERKLNLKAVDQLMNFPGVVSPNTYFKNVYSMKAGHLMLFHGESDPQDLEYWDMCFSEAVEEDDKGEEYYVENVKSLLKQAISRRLVADVPIGFYVSGGLDSSMVSCFIGKFLLNSYYSFSAEIGTNELDESRYQKLVKETVQSEHYSVKISDECIFENLKNILYYTESAVKESYDVAAYKLSSLVKQSPAKAVLTGQGADELFGGYVGYMLDQFRLMQKNNMSEEEQKCNELLWGDRYFRYERNHPGIRPIHKKLYAGDVRAQADQFSALRESPIDVRKLEGLSATKRRSYVDLKLRLCDHLLTEHGDHMFFANSVEGRHPFLDAELMRFVAQMPDHYKINGTNEKYVLKRAGRGIVPEEILKRKKFPFQAQGMSSLVKNTDIYDYACRELVRKQGIFDPAYVDEMFQNYVKEDFKLAGAYDIDYLMIVVTVTLLCERFHLSV